MKPDEMAKWGKTLNIIDTKDFSSTSQLCQVTTHTPFTSNYVQKTLLEHILHISHTPGAESRQLAVSKAGSSLLAVLSDNNSQPSP